MKAREIARFGLLTAAALVLGYIERFIPLAPGIPGIKLGLSNTVLLYAIYLMNWKSAICLMLLKVTLSGLLFSGISAMLYAFAGGALSLLVMVLLHRAKGFSIVGVSVAGAVVHNIGQIAVACLVVRTQALLGYLPVLLIAGVVTGVLTGMVARLVILALEKTGGAGR